MLRIVREDEICRRIMTILGIGPLVAYTFKSAIADSGRIAKSKTVDALFGLVPKKYQSGASTSPPNPCDRLASLTSAQPLLR
jgi:transposase